jgi:hypothetical protein
MLKRFLLVFFPIFVTFSFAEFELFEVKIDESKVGKIIYVDNENPKSSDENPGTEELPLKTIKKAIQIVEENNSKGIGVKVVIKKGTYRESIELPFRGNKQTDAPIIIEGDKNGKTIIKGSDIWNDWERHKETNIYTHKWEYKWGLAPYPPNWEGFVKLEDIVRRREMIFVNGEMLEQVLSPIELKEGSFYVSEEKGMVYIWLPSTIDIKKAEIEVSVRSGLMRIDGRKNVIVRNLIFMHDNTPVQGSAVGAVNSQNIIFEDCQFLWNNWGGFGYGVCNNVVVRRCIANYNGGTGMGAFKCKNILFEDNETSYNNWRGARGNFLGWAVAGVKVLLIHNGLFKNHKSFQNQTRAFWFDTDCRDIIVDNAFWCNNLTEGIFIEANQGPIIIKNSKICFNKSWGILSNSANIILENNIIYGNEKAQIKFTGGKEIVFKNWETQKEERVKPEGWKFLDNVIVGVKKYQLLIDTQPWEFFFSSLSSSRNLYYNNENKNCFQIGPSFFNFSEWQNLTGQDLDSSFADPSFANPENYDFSLKKNSPLKQKNKWKKMGFSPDEYRKGFFVENVKKIWEKPYPFLENIKEKKFKTVDIKKYANRGLKGEDAFIGGGNLILPEGIQTIHGVQFEIINQDLNNGFSAIALKSKKLKNYPEKIEIPLNEKVKALYFLHGCGWISKIGKIGEYEFYYEDGSKRFVEIIADDPIPQQDSNSNICDWWPTYGQIEKENAKYVPVVFSEGTRYIYTLQWINPKPDKKIEKIILKSNPEKDATLIIISITALLN